MKVDSLEVSSDVFVAKPKYLYLMHKTPVHCRINGHKKSHELSSVITHTILSSKSYFYNREKSFRFSLNFPENLFRGNICQTFSKTIRNE